MIKLTIDGKEIETEQGKTILEAARDNGIYIPTLCYHANLLSIGSCRICVVEAEGYSNPMASCATAAQDGMKIRTETEKLFAMRQDYLKLLLAYHPLECPICDAGGECDLQDLVFEHKIEKADLSVTREHRVAPYSTPLIRYFDNRCVLCLRCIHACREVSGRNVLDLVETGIEARMAPERPQECISCGECQFVCPVGSLTENLSPLKSRFWQVERHLTTCPHCGFGCTFELDVQEHRFVTDVIQKVENLPNRGSLCVMGRFGYDFVNHEAKLSQIPKEGPVAVSAEVPVSEKAKTAHEHLSTLDAEGKGIGFVVSPRATNEEIFLIREIAGCLRKAFLTTSAFYHTGRVWQAFKGMNISYRYRYDSLRDADLIVIAGANLLSNNHLLGNRVRDAFKLSGSKIVVIDPAPTALTRIANMHLRVKPGRDGMLFNAFSRRLVQEEKDPKEGRTAEGYDAFSSMLKNVDQEGAIAESGISPGDFERMYRLISNAGNIAVIFGSGISTSDESLTALLNFCVLCGSAAKGLVMPIARESNAVGAVSILEKGRAPHEVIADPAVSALFFFQDDPYHYMKSGTVQEGLKGKKLIIVADAFPTFIMDQADLAVPTGVLTQKDGTFVAGDGYGRRLERMMTGSSDGFEFLRDLLILFGGTAYRSVSDVTERLQREGILSLPAGTSSPLRGEGRGEGEGARSGAGQAVFNPDKVTTAPSSGGSHTLILRDVFVNHHLIDKDVYSKGISLAYGHPGYPVSGDKLYISPEDAVALGVLEGENVLIESQAGSVSKAVSVKEGLRPGVLEYIVFRDRREALGLSQTPAKWIDVKVSKG